MRLKGYANVLLHLLERLSEALRQLLVGLAFVSLAHAIDGISGHADIIPNRFPLGLQRVNSLKKSIRSSAVMGANSTRRTSWALRNSVRTLEMTAI